MGAPRTTPQVLEYLMNHPGLVVYRRQIVEATGLDESQVRNAILNLRNRTGENIEVVMHGASWIWRPRPGVDYGMGPTPAATEPTAPVSAAPAQRRVFEQIGTTRSGDLVIQCEQGNLYRAIELS